MQSTARGFTLIETVIATGILAIGAGAIASLFVSSIKINMYSHQRLAAAALLSDKLEQLKKIADNGEFSEYAAIASDGSVLHSTSDTSLPYLRSWEVSGTELKVITVVVYGNHWFRDTPIELTRATTATARQW